MTRYAATVKMFPSEFINVDLDIKSRSNLDFLVNAWKGGAIRMHTPKLGRQHWLRLELLPQPKSPAEAIRRIGKLVGGLSTRGRTVWRRAQSKEFDIGIQAGFERRSGEWCSIRSLSKRSLSWEPACVSRSFAAASSSRKCDRETRKFTRSPQYLM